jgi:hypothetical protein
MVEQYFIQGGSKLLKVAIHYDVSLLFWDVSQRESRAKDVIETTKTMTAMTAI